MKKVLHLNSLALLLVTLPIFSMEQADANKDELPSIANTLEVVIADFHDTRDPRTEIFLSEFNDPFILSIEDCIII